MDARDGGDVKILMTIAAVVLSGCGAGVEPLPPEYGEAKCEAAEPGRWGAPFEVAGGRDYAFSVRHREDGIPETLGLFVGWYDANWVDGDQRAGLIEMGGVSIPPSATWDAFSTQGTAPAGALNARIFVLVDGPEPRPAVFLDCVTMAEVR